MKLDSVNTTKVDYGVGVLRGLLFDVKLPKRLKINSKELGEAIEHIRGAARAVEREQQLRFKRRSKANKKPKDGKITIDKKVLTDLGSAVLFALKFSKMSGSRQQTDKDGKTVYVAWQETFMAALDGIGYCIDRKEFWKQKSKKGRKR